jgi:large subunit ribosomal protein L34e
MVAPNKRSRPLRRVKRKTPGGTTRMKYVKRSPSVAHCANCSAVLKGVVRARASKLHKMSKTKKRPKRPFGGVLCTKCTRQEFIRRARK